MSELRDRRFVAYWHFVGWWAISCGCSLDFRSPNIEVHLPFGFVRVGWIGVEYFEEHECIWDRSRPGVLRVSFKKTFGWDP